MAKSPAKKPAAKTTFDPFAKVASSKAKSSSLAVIQTKGQTASAVDQYADLHAQIKLLEGQQEGFKDEILGEAKSAFAERLFDGQSGNLKVLGTNESVTFITQNSGSGLNASDLEILTEKFGKKTVAALTEPDLGSLKFKPDFIGSAENQKRLFETLARTFNQDELAEMFQPITHKVKSTVIESAVEHVKSAEELADLYTALKLKAYIKV